MFKKLVWATLLFCCACFRSGAQEQDSTWYYANTLMDYATADLVCLVRLGETKVLDTTGGYSIQEVSFEPIKFYKGAGRPKKFRAWLESHEPVWKAGTVRGYYLLKADPAPGHKSGQEGEMYYWLENAGFATTDTPFVALLPDTAHFKKMVAQYILPEIAGSWAKVTFLELIPPEDPEYGYIKAKIRLENDVPGLRLNKGQTLFTEIHKSPYLKTETLLGRIRKNIICDVAMFIENEHLTIKSEFILEP